MFAKKTLGVAFACALALGAWSGSALAGPITIDGVVVNTDSPLNLNIQAINFRESSVMKVGDVLTGYGQIGSVNGVTDAIFCPSCDLTFTFQYTVSALGSSNGNPQVIFDNGSINVYVQADNSFDVTNPDSVDTSNLWLSLAGHTAPHTGFAPLGQLYSTISGTLTNPTNGSSGFGLLDATGGPAQGLADFNNIDDDIGGVADLTLDSSFQFQDLGICGDDGTCYPITGTGGIIGAKSQVTVPEPAELGLLGLGLAAIGFLLRRRRKESDERA